MLQPAGNYISFVSVHISARRLNNSGKIKMSKAIKSIETGNVISNQRNENWETEGDVTGSHYAIATETDTSIEMRKNGWKKIIYVLEIHRLGARNEKKNRQRKIQRRQFLYDLQADKHQQSTVSAIMIEV